MGTVYRKTVTRPLPAGAELFTKGGKRFARWKNSKGRKQVSPVTTGKDGTDRLVVQSPTFVAKYRDGQGIVCKVSTGCRDEDAARSILSKLERRAELVKANVITSSEDAIADHQTTPLADHFQAYLAHVKTNGATDAHIASLKSKAERLSADCGLTTLKDIATESLEEWLNARQVEGMAARTRNTYLQALLGFCKWCVQSERLTSNPLARIAKADEKSAPRRQRRSMTEAELMKLLQVARLRPLADLGRETVAIDGTNAEATGKRRKRSNWKYRPLTLDMMPAAVERARERLKDNPEAIAERERIGRERALIYKTLILTGLRKGELASLTIGQLELDGPMPFVVLDAADEKNRQGSTIPLRADLANDLRQWLSDTPNAAKLRMRNHNATSDSKRPLFTVPDALGKILDRDLQAAGIAKRDERGWTIDVHALRHSFGTLLSKAGVAPRTAQAAMRYSNIDLTMNVYTDPKLLDVMGALDSLPSFNWKPPTETERATMRATGTDDHTADSVLRAVAPDVAPNGGKRGVSLAFPVIASTTIGERTTRRANTGKPRFSREKALFAGIANKASVECPRQESNLQPSASEADGDVFDQTTAKEVTSTDYGACTTACTSEPKTRRKREPDPTSQPTGKNGSGDFAAALAMIATLPLSDAENAEAVRRLLCGKGE